MPLKHGISRQLPAVATAAVELQDGMRNRICASHRVLSSEGESLGVAMNQNQKVANINLIRLFDRLR